MSRAHPLRVADYLQHPLEAIGNIQDYTVGMNLAAFLADRKTCDAVIRNLEVIGLDRDRLRPGRLDCGHGGVGVGLARSAVVVDGDSPGAVYSEVARDRPAEVLGAAGGRDHLAVDGMVCHGHLPCDGLKERPV